MGKKAKSKDTDDLGFVPLEASGDDIGFTPEESEAAGSQMAAAAFPTMDAPEEEGLPFYHPQTVFETGSDVVTTLPQGVTTWADEIQAATTAGAKKIGGSEIPFSDLYDEDVSEIRKNVGEARNRSPWATGIGELAAGAGSALLPTAAGIPALGAVLGAGKYTGAAPMVARGAFEGLGVANDKASMEGVTTSLGGAAIGGLGSLASGALKKISTANPKAIRANILGAGSSEFKDIGIKERQEIADELHKMGLFQNTKVEYDTNAGKFISKGKSLESVEKPVRDKLQERLQSATEQIQKDKLKVIDQFIDDPIDFDGLKNSLDGVVEKYTKKGSGFAERAAEATRIRDEIIGDIEHEMTEYGITEPTIGMIEDAKQRIQANVGNYGKNALLQKTPDTMLIYQNMYSDINKGLRQAITDKRYTSFNEMQQKMLTAQTDLAKAIASENSQQMRAGWGGWGNKIMNATVGTPESGLGTAAAADFMNKPGLKQLKAPLRMGVEEAPFGTIRYLDPSIPRQQEKKMPLINFAPHDIINFRIPRTTNGILEQKDKVLAKFVQKGLPDEMIETLAMALDGDPEDVSDIMPMIYTQFPEHFEKSKYKIFDNKFIDPNDRARAADATSKREDIDSIQRAKMISKINKTGDVPEGFV
jgi:hypothetical protein